MLLGQVGERLERVELAGVHLARVPDQDRRRAAQLREPALEAGEVDAADLVAGERPHRVPPDPELGERLARARVDEAAREHRGRGQSGSPVGADVAPVLLAPPLPRGRESREVRRGGARREHSSPRRGQLEELLQPVDGHGLEPGAEGRADPAEGVLVERGRQPVGAERRRRHSAGDEVEEPRPRRGRGGVEPADQLAEGVDRACSLLRQRPAEAGGGLLGALREHRPLVEAGQPGGGLLEGEPGGRLRLVRQGASARRGRTWRRL